MDINLSKQYNDIISLANEAVLHIDSSCAREALGKIADLLTYPDLQKQQPEIYNNLLNLRTTLQIVDFSNLSDIEAANILRTSLLTFFKNEIPLEDRIVDRYNWLGYQSKEAQRVLLKKAILENKELLGRLPIGEWLANFDKKFDVKTRTENSILSFLSEDPAVRSLTPKENNILKKILFTYETLLASKFLDIYDIAATANAGSDVKTNNDYRPAANYMSTEQVSQQDISSIESVQLPLSDALKGFPELGEQLITSEKIKLKSFPEPVRPSIKNWLADYTFTLGQGSHDAIVRGNYVFHSDNTIRLSNQDREKLAYVLKAYDEGLTVTVNKNTKQLIFDSQRSVVNNSQIKESLESEARPSQSQGDFPKPGFRNSAPSSSSMHNNISFSSPQKLPYEKIHLVKSDKVGLPSEEFKRSSAPAPVIRPVFNKPAEPAKPRELPRNVVNLKEQ